MRNAATRLRAAASLALAVALLIAVAPAALAAPATPDEGLVTGLSSPVDAFSSPVELGPRTGQAPLLGVLTSPTLMLSGVADLTSTPLATTVSAASRVIVDAKAHLGARYRWGAQGPRTFDCSGLVLRAYSDAGVIGRLGGWGNRSGYAIYRYGLRHHLVSRTNGQPGDVVVWGGGGHVGIYLGHGMAISALVNGVRIHGIYAVTKRFTAFVHTGLGTLGVRHATSVTVAKARSIGVRHAATTLSLRAAHDATARSVSTLRAGTRLTLLRIWRDPHGRTWYRVNANQHVGWVAGWLTRT